MGGRLFIGKTNNLNVQIDEHFSYHNSIQWTKTHQPIGINKIIENCDNNDMISCIKAYLKRVDIKNIQVDGFTFKDLNKLKLKSM